MQFTINVDCTPIEARTFLGLPDLTPLHNTYIEQMQKLISQGVSPADVERFLSAWLPAFGTNWEQWQRSFWNAAGGQQQKG